MTLTEFNDTIAHLREFFDACTFELRTKNLEQNTFLYVKEEGKRKVLLEICFTNSITIKSHLGYDNLGLSINYEYAHYDANDLSPSTLSAVKSIISMFSE